MMMMMIDSLIGKRYVVNSLFFKKADVCYTCNIIYDDDDFFCVSLSGFFLQQQRLKLFLLVDCF